MWIYCHVVGYVMLVMFLYDKNRHWVGNFCRDGFYTKKNVYLTHSGKKWNFPTLFHAYLFPIIAIISILLALLESLPVLFGSGMWVMMLLILFCRVKQLADDSPNEAPCNHSTTSAIIDENETAYLFTVVFTCQWQEFLIGTSEAAYSANEACDACTRMVSYTEAFRYRTLSLSTCEADKGLS